MKRVVLLALIFSGLTATLATANDDAGARKMAGKDYEAATTKIRADDAIATDKCRSGAGAAVAACLIQALGKRTRAEQEAKLKMDRVGEVHPLAEAETKKASDAALQGAKDGRRGARRDIDAETKAASAECKKLDGAARKTCNKDVALRGDEARDMADAMFKKSRSDAKALRTQ